MARQKGIIKIKGQIGDLSFYQSQDGFMAREKGGVDGKRIARDPAFQRTRENGQEFAEAARAGKLLRDAIRPMLRNAVDNRAVSRLVKIMTLIKNLDPTSVRGERNVDTGILTPEAKELLRGFDFNVDSSLRSKLYKPYAVNAVTGEITISNLVAREDLIYPEGATHYNMKAARARIDFNSGASEYFGSNVLSLPIDDSPQSVMLTPGGLPTGTGTDFFVLKIEFYQKVNNVNYSLKNGVYNLVSIVEVI